MPYRIRWEGHGVYRRYFGRVTLQDLMDAYEEMCSDLRYAGIRYVISDFLEAVPGNGFRKRALQRFAEIERLRYFSSPETVQAMVATDQKMLEHLRYFENIRVSPYCMKDFTTVAEARHWIASNPRLGWSRPSP